MNEDEHTAGHVIDWTPSPAVDPEDILVGRTSDVDALCRRACRTVAVTSLVLTVAVWGITYAREAGDLYAALARLAGWLATLLYAGVLVLVSRMPMLERAYGHAALLHLHAVVGPLMLASVVGHVVLYLVGHFAGDYLPAALVLATDPAVLAAVVGTVAIVLVAATSARPVRTWLERRAEAVGGNRLVHEGRLHPAADYRGWHLVHLASYLALALAIPHELGRDTWLAQLPVMKAFLLVVVGAAYAAVLLFRLVLPLRANQVAGYRVIAVVTEPSDPRSDVDVVSVGVAATFSRADAERQAEELALGTRRPRTDGPVVELALRGGQFAIFRTADRQWFRGNPYSVRREGDMLWFTVRAPAGRNRWKDVRPGTRLIIEGPYGRWTSAERTRRRVTVIVAGVAIAAARALVEDLADVPGPIVLIYRARSDADELFVDELARLAADRGVTLVRMKGHHHEPHPAYGDGWLPDTEKRHHGHQVLHDLAPYLRESDVYVAGRPGFMDQVVAAARQLDVPPKQIHRELFRW